MIDDHLVLAGGGHTHSLILHRWRMYPHLKPKGLITLISRDSTTIYSGMLPGLIAGHYKIDQLSINLRELAEQSNISLVIAEIIGLDLINNLIVLKDRAPISFTMMSIDIGSETKKSEEYFQENKQDLGIPIKPFSRALQWIEEQDQEDYMFRKKTVTVVGSGFSAVEVVLALRTRWELRPLQLQADLIKLNPKFKNILLAAKVDLISIKDPIKGPTLLCTGSMTPDWLQKSNLPSDSFGRVITSQTLQVINYPNLFAVGDCGVIENNYRAASGVWAVRAAKPLARNLERCSLNLKPAPWRPQRRALQLIGAGQLKTKKLLAWGFWGDFVFGPNHLLWRMKEIIDKRFMEKFELLNMRRDRTKSVEEMACRGCAAKLPAQPLKEALKQANLSTLGNYPEDAALITSLDSCESIFQSVDGFPALLSDPWLNGRLTALHACSDLWAMGSLVNSAQVFITLPKVPVKIQQELLAQSLAGINSALEEQGAKLIGGHTVEARSDSPDPSALGIQIALSVNGLLPGGFTPWVKGGLELGDELLISREIGSGVFFAAARVGKVPPQDLDALLKKLARSQHTLLELLVKLQNQKNASRLIHACTDITGFGLLGHLEEMLCSSNENRLKAGLSLLRINLQAELIPFYKGALTLFDAGHASSLAPENRKAWRLLEKNGDSLVPMNLLLGADIEYDSNKYHQIMELIVDPQTCGPLLIACEPEIAEELVSNGPWQRIGYID